MDGTDIYDTYGVWITRGGYNGLLTFPELKEPPANDWPDEDGVEVDLSMPVLAQRQIPITFFASNPGTPAGEFTAFLSSPGYRSVFIPALGRTWNLRLLSHSANRLYSGGKASFTLQFAEDSPVRPVPAAYAPGVRVPASAYSIDDVPLNRYGIVVTDAKSGLLEMPPAKTNLTRNIQSRDGVIYDAGSMVLNGKETMFKCYLKTATTGAFWNCYDAFFSALAGTGERTLSASFTAAEYSCYYKRSSGFRIAALWPAVLVEFSFTLVLTGGFRNENKRRKR
jgi:hypothetical protein